MDVRSQFISFSGSRWDPGCYLIKQNVHFWVNKTNLKPQKPPPTYPSLSSILNSFPPPPPWQDDRNNLTNRDWQLISEINIYNWLLLKFILGEGSILSPSQISWSYLFAGPEWVSFPKRVVSFQPPPSRCPLSEINVCLNPGSDDSKSLSVSERAALSAQLHFPSEQRPGPAWACVGPACFSRAINQSGARTRLLFIPVALAQQGIKELRG